MMCASTLNILTELEEREGTHTREGERTLEDAPKLQEQETDREEEKEDSVRITCTDEVLKQTSTTTGSLNASLERTHTPSFFVDDLFTMCVHVQFCKFDFFCIYISVIALSTLNAILPSISKSFFRFIRLESLQARFECPSGIQDVPDNDSLCS